MSSRVARYSSPNAVHCSVFGVVQARVVLVDGRHQRDLAGPLALENPVRRAVRVGVAPDGAPRQDLAPEARHQDLPVALDDLAGLLDVDQVELGREDAVGVVQAGDDDLRPVRQDVGLADPRFWLVSQGGVPETT
jgi:hypothetical protein